MANLAKNEWYVDYEKNICHQNCLVGTGETQYGVAGVSGAQHKKMICT